MDCFVTGASGFLGGNLVHELTARGHHVKALLRPGSDLRGLAEARFEPVEGNLSDRDKLKAAMRRVMGNASYCRYYSKVLDNIK